MNIIVCSNSSFITNPVRLGLQMLALELAKQGHEVDYLPTPSNPFDWVAPHRRPRWVKAWFQQHGKYGTQIHPDLHLTEYLLRSPFPRSRKFWKHPQQLHLYSAFLPQWIKEKKYDACIYDTSFSSLFRHRIKAKRFIFRLNDNPEGFTFHMHPWVVENLKQSIQNKNCHEIWATSTPLMEWAQKLNPNLPIRLIPNGVDLEAFKQPHLSSIHPQSKSAIYLGAISQWFDVSLIQETANLLPDWQFNIYGPDPSKRLKHLTDSNIKICGSIPFSSVPVILRNHKVGLIPFSSNTSLLKAIDPLKAYQYLAAGLGIASTDQGNLKQQLQPIAHFGSSPETFAQAIEKAANTSLLSSSKKEKILQDHSWKNLGKQCHEALKISE